MAIVRGQSLMVGQASTAISGKSGIVLFVEVQMTGRTLTSDGNFAESNMQFYAVDGALRFPLGGNTSNPTIIGFLSRFDYRNPAYDDFRMVDNLGLGTIKLATGAIHKTGFFENNLTIVSIPIDATKPHDLNVSWEIYEFD